VRKPNLSKSGSGNDASMASTRKGFLVIDLIVLIQTSVDRPGTGSHLSDMTTCCHYNSFMVVLLVFCQRVQFEEVQTLFHRISFLK
jgi:hypothetical protein